MHGGRSQSVGSGADPELAETVEAPGIDVAVGQQGEEKYSPALIADGVAVIEETTGVVEVVVVPLPSCP